MALGKPSPLSITLGVILTGVVGYLIYVATTNVETSSYSKGATHTENVTTYSPTYNAYPLSVPPICGAIFKMDTPGVPVKPETKGKK